MDTSIRLDGRVAVITGAAGSIGGATARLLAAQGARVMLADLNAPALAALADELGPDRASGVAVDVTDAGQVRQLMQRTVDRFGGLDILFSNAGTAGPIRPIADYPDDDFDRVLAVHVRGAFLCCKHAAPLMRAGGSIVVTSSIVGVKGDPGPYGYIAAKHAQVGLMRSLAKELAPRGIRVNTVHPGPIANDFQRGVEGALSPLLGRDAGAFFDEVIPMGRHGQPEEVARAVLFLASGMGSFVTGSLLMVDGGLSA